MALFKENKSTSSSSTFIAQDIEVTGDFKGKGSVQVEGTVNGNISVDSVIIGENAEVNGNIEAKNVVINGKLNGTIHCNSLDVMGNGSIFNNIVSKNIQLSGLIKGNVIVSELLDISSTGSINGKITLSRLIIEEGGKVIGSIEQYKEKETAKIKEVKPTPTEEHKQIKKPHPKGKKA